MVPIPSPDLIAVLWFALCWVGYDLAARRRGRVQPGLHEAVYPYRAQWMQRVLERDNRIADASLMGNLMNSVAFFASTAVVLIGGLVAALGASKTALAVLAELPFATRLTPAAWNFRVLALLTLFVYAFFKFTWSLRQFNLCCILIGAAPLKVADATAAAAYAGRAAHLHALAGAHYNQGLRAYYSGLAMLTWFIHPGVFMAVAAGLMVILHRREFAPDLLTTLRPPAPVIEESAT